jgi:hypothetical protein
VRSGADDIYIIFLVDITSLDDVESESRLKGGVNRANLKFTNLITTTSRVSVRNINESERGRENKSQANKE